MPLLAAVRAAGQRLTCAGGQEASCDVTALQIHSGDLAASVFLYIFLYSVSSLFTCHNLALVQMKIHARVCCIIIIIWVGRIRLIVNICVTLMFSLYFNKSDLISHSLLIQDSYSIYSIHLQSCFCLYEPLTSLEYRSFHIISSNTSHLTIKHLPEKIPAENFKQHFLQTQID